MIWRHCNIGFPNFVARSCFCWLHTAQVVAECKMQNPESTRSPNNPYQTLTLCGVVFAIIILVWREVFFVKYNELFTSCITWTYLTPGYENQWIWAVVSTVDTTGPNLHIGYNTHSHSVLMLYIYSCPALMPLFVIVNVYNTGRESMENNHTIFISTEWLCIHPISGDSRFVIDAKREWYAAFMYFF